MANPNPRQTADFLKYRLKRDEVWIEGGVIDNRELSKRPTAVRLPIEVYEALQKVPGKCAWLRQVIEAALIRDSYL